MDCLLKQGKLENQSLQLIASSIARIPIKKKNLTNSPVAYGLTRTNKL